MKPKAYTLFSSRFLATNATVLCGTLALTLSGTVSQAANVYWDSNGDTAGAGATPNGTWGVDNFWNPTEAGDTTTPGAWNAGDTAVFAAGNDASGGYTVTLDGIQSVAGITVQEGTPVIAGPGSLQLAGSAGIRVNGGASASISAAIDGGTNSMYKEGDGALTLSGTTSLTGDFVINGGDLTISSTVGTIDNIRFQWNYTAHQNLNIVAGADITTKRFVMADLYYAENTVSHSGGTLNVTGSDDSNSTSASFFLGHWGYGSTSTYELSGGTLNALNARLSLGWDRSNVQFNQSGGTANLRGINLNNGRGNTASVNVTGGRLNLGAGGINNQANKSVNLGGGTLGAFANWTSAKPINLTGSVGAVTIDTADSNDGTTARSITLAAGTSGSGGIIKSGVGSLSLGGTNSYTGDTVLNGGGFYPGTSLTSTKIQVNSGASLACGTLTSAGTSTLDEVESNGGNLSVRLGVSGDVLDIATLNVVTASTVEGVPMEQLISGDEFTVLKYGTLSGLGFAGLSTAPSANPHYATTLVHDSGAQEIKIKVTSADSIIWTGSSSGVWDTNGTDNWKLSSALPSTVASKFYKFDIIAFDDTSSVGTITVTGTVEPAGLVVSNDTTNYEFSGGAIGGLTGITKSGAASLSLLSPNSFTGDVDIQDGKVITNSAASLGTGSNAIKLGTAATLSATSSYTLSRGLNLYGGSATIEVDSGSTLSRTGGFSGGSTLTKTGDGTLSFQSSAGAFGGSIVIDAGTVVMNGGVFNATIGLSSITVNTGAVLRQPSGAFHALGGAWAPTPALNIFGGTYEIGQENYLDTIVLEGGTIQGIGGNPEIRSDLNFTFKTLASATPSQVLGARIRKVNKDLTIETEDGAATSDLVFSGILDPAGAPWAKTGAGTMEITTSQSFTDGTNVNAGTLLVNAAMASPITVNASATLGGTGSTTGTITVKSSANLAPGASIESLGGGGLTLEAGSNLAMEIDSSSVDSDLLEISGDVSLAGTLNVSDLASSPVALPLGTKLVLITYTGSISGVFTGLEEGAGVTVGPNTFVIDYHDSGAVTLTVGTPDPFAAWATANGATGGKAGDTDGDGVSNLLEFATNSNPTDGSSVARVYPRMHVIGGSQALTLTVATRSGAMFANGAPDAVKQTATKDNVVYTVEASDELTAWNVVDVDELDATTSAAVQAALGSTLPTLSSGWEWHTFRTDGTVSTDSSDFIRLRVEEAP